jgi:zinc transporter, ZIP family
VFEALGLGTLAQSSLLLAGLFVCYVTVPRRLVGVLAGFGAGALIAAVSFDLIAEADELPSWEMALWMLIGVAVFLGGDALVERRLGSEGAGASMGIVVGSVVDGVPESIIFGIQVATGFPISVSFLAAVFVSNIPQAIAPSADLAASGWSTRRLGSLWLFVVLACGAAAALGFSRRTRRARRTAIGWPRADAVRLRSRRRTCGRGGGRRLLRLPTRHVRDRADGDRWRC